MLNAWLAKVRADTVEHCREQLACNLVHVGNHQQQSLRGCVCRCQRSGLQRPVHGAGGAAFALHFLYQHRLAKDIAAAGCGPFVHIFGHCRRRGDRVDGSDFREHVAHVGSGLIAVACYEFLFSTHCWWFMLLLFQFFRNCTLWIIQRKGTIFFAITMRR